MASDGERLAALAAERHISLRPKAQAEHIQILPRREP
jgi:hypothetical protein